MTAQDLANDRRREARLVSLDLQRLEASMETSGSRRELDSAAVPAPGPSPHEGRRAALSGWARLFKSAQLVVMGVTVLALAGAVAFFTVPRLLGWHGVIILTGSMEPALKVGGLAYVDEGVKPEDIKAGDIITFKSPENDTQVTHRAIQIDHDDGGHILFRTKGDANADVDQLAVPQNYLVGRVVLHVASVGNISNWVRQKQHLYLLLWFPAALIIGTELVNIYKGLRGQEKAAP